MKKLVLLILFIGIQVVPSSIFSYPIDGYEVTGIRRLDGARLIQAGEVKGTKQPAGALLKIDEVDLRLLSHKNFGIPEPDSVLTAGIRKILGGNVSRYGISVLDLSDPNNPRYGEHRGDLKQNVGSVGKILAALALFQALADIYTDDIEARKRILRATVITADDFILSDHHTVRLWNPETRKLNRRPLRHGDKASLWEYLDFMMSASSNAAASMVIKQVLLMARFGKNYPVSDDTAKEFLKNTSKTELKDLFLKAMLDPLARNGLDQENLRQGSFFTWKGKQLVPGTNSYGTAKELMLFCLKLEQGKLVDEFSSREIKRLLYMTERRIRYSAAPVLKDAAVYFKSGSLYKCKPEEGFTCKKYHGNVINYMNSVAIVESPAGNDRKHFYIVTLISNVLRKNSAWDHLNIATKIHKLIKDYHSTRMDQSGRTGQ